MTDHKDSKKPRRNSRIRGYARFSGIAFQMVVIIGLGTYGGVKLDEKYPNEHSLFTVIFSLISVGIATYFVIRQATNFSNKNDGEN